MLHRPTRATAQAGVSFALLMALAATLSYSLMSALVKMLSAGYPTGEILFFRGFFGLIPPLLYVAATGSWRRLRSERPWPHAIRAFGGLTAQGLNYAALALLPLSTASALGYTSPIFILILAAALFGDRIHRRSGLAIAVGLCGILLIVKPSAGSLLGTLLALGGAAIMAMSTLSIRLLKAEDNLNVAVRYAGFTALFSLPLAFLHFVPPSLPDLALLVGVGVLGGTGQILLILAYRFGRPAQIAPVEYTSMIWAMLLQAVLFGQLPDALAYCGAALLLVCGFLVVKGSSASQPHNRDR